jgi:pimeloyl-ACP methyl ester carboxylesterase
MDGDIEELRGDPTAIEHVGVEEIVDHYDGIISELDAPPIIMGHSFGGAFTQIMLERVPGVIAARTVRPEQVSPCESDHDIAGQSQLRCQPAANEAQRPSASGAAGNRCGQRWTR